MDSSSRIPAGTPIPKISISTGSFVSARTDVALCFAFQQGAILGPPAASALGKALARVARDEKFKGKRKEVLLWTSAGRFPAVRYMVVGLGKRAAFSTDMLREACGFAGKRAAAAKAVRMAVSLPAGLDAGTLAEASVEGLCLGSYRMSKYLTSVDAIGTPLAAAELYTSKENLASARAGVTRGTLRAKATNLVRDLVNEPAIALTPSRMAAVARTIARAQGLEIKVHEKKDLQKMGMGAILGVSAGSVEPPCVIHLTYRPAAPKLRIALVGKGLTFDSGGLSLKTATGMETMKLDKAGASVVLGVMAAVAELKPDVEVHGIMGMTENMPGGAALKPGDILKTMGGKTIEVLNTDAEGRLVLADALAYAQTLKPAQIIDLATLTGACMVALGPVVTGVFGTDQAMVDKFLAAARSAGEKMWQLPLCEDYSDQLRSELADIKNIPTSRYGGAITAALFLKTFVADTIPWIHLDIAGPAFLESEQGFMRKGATGAVVRTLLTYLGSLR